MYLRSNLFTLVSLLAFSSLSFAATADLNQDEPSPRHLRQGNVERHLVDCALPSGNFRLKHNSRWLQMEGNSIAGHQRKIKASKNKDGSTTKWTMAGNAMQCIGRGDNGYARKDDSSSNNDRFKGGSLTNSDIVVFQATNSGTDCTNVKIKIGGYWLKHDGGESDVDAVSTASEANKWTIVSL